MALSQIVFPHPFEANEDGLLAYSHQLTEMQILLAYRFGIFPWNNSGEPIFWWFISPRMVLFPPNIKIAKSMRPYFNQRKYHITINHSFEKVIEECKKIRVEQGEGTWIHKDLKDAFINLHHKGFAHSVEVWDQEGELAGGLYGLSLGKIFFGESMFSRKRNASKFALISLAQLLEKAGFELIDCQIYTEHLESMGAQLISKEAFLGHLKRNAFEDDKAFLDIPGADGFTVK